MRSHPSTIQVRRHSQIGASRPSSTRAEPAFLALRILPFPITGTIIPGMGNVSKLSIADVLFSSVQRKVLAILFAEPDRSFYTNELAKRGKTGRGALQRELARMTEVGLISMTVSGNQKHYSANKKSPIFQELRGITLKTFGLKDVLKDALAAHEDRIRLAFIYGSVAKGTDTAASDIDVMIIATGLTYSDVFEALTPSEQGLGRKVNPTLYTPEEFAKKIADDNHFVTRVLDQPKIILIGDESAIPNGQPEESAEDRQP